MAEISPFDDTRPIPVRRFVEEALPPPAPVHRRRSPLRLAALLAVLLVVGWMAALLSGRTNVLLLGIDRTPAGSAVGRSDSMILTTFVPAQGYVGMLSIPRDLWLPIPGVGENRVNTAHFFGEAAQEGGGPAAAVDAVSVNFGISLEYYIRVQFDAFRSLVDALGGVPLVLEEPAGGLSAGEHLLNGEEALAFIRSRAGSDDFFRMAHGQLFLRALVRRAISPVSWPRIPVAAAVLFQGVDTNLPLWRWPALAWSVLITGPNGIDGRVIDRTMVQGFTTGDGAQVLAPDWSQINPVLLDMFGE